MRMIFSKRLLKKASAGKFFQNFRSSPRPICIPKIKIAGNKKNSAKFSIDLPSKFQQFGPRRNPAPINGIKDLDFCFVKRKKREYPRKITVRIIFNSRFMSYPY